MESLLHIGYYALSFVLVLSVIVFVHEFGHFFAARLCGVRVEVFSIGFGRELCGFTSKYGTRWKFSMLPLGGYVKMFGDASAASTADTHALEMMSEADKKVSFHHQSLRAKAFIVAAGPLANFLLSIAVFTYFIFTIGLSSTEPVVGSVMKDSPAFHAGLVENDIIEKVDGKPVHYFRELATEIALSTGKPVRLDIRRGEKHLVRSITPTTMEDSDGLGNTITRPVIGIKSKTIVLKEVGLVAALWHATKQTYEMCVTTLRVMGQMIRGDRSTDELKGPLGIAKLSGDAAQSGEDTAKSARAILWLIALLSVNLGFINLFPIPMLDGGHLLFYVIEGLRGRPLAKRVQEYSFRLGFAMILCLMAFTIWNDIRQIIL